MSAVFFGSISTIADTSELQRAAFNQAFAEHGLDWQWEQADYASQLRSNGGQDRVAQYAKDRGEDVDARAVHETKSRLFQKSLATASLVPRPGVTDTIRAAQQAGTKLALVTTTSPANVAALLDAVKGDIQTADFDLVVDSTQVQAVKPDPACYAFALQSLGEQASDCVAVEDNVGGVHAALAAGVRCVAFPNENTAAHEFDDADQVVDRLDPDGLVRA